MRNIKSRVITATALLAIGCSGLAGLIARAAGPATQPATQPVDKTQAVIQQTEKYYADLYSTPFKMETDARLAHLVAIISLSRIDGPPLTEKLLVPAEYAKTDPLAAQVAWEALRARAMSLSPAQQQRWLDFGLKDSGEGSFPGETAGSLIESLSSRPIDPKDAPAIVKLLLRVAEENDPATAGGKRALDKAAGAVAAWSDPKLIDRVIKEMDTKTARNQRIVLLLAKLPSPPAEATAAAWSKWLIDAKLQPAKSLPPLQAKSDFFKPPEKIVDPFDKKWIKESELTDLRLNKLDLIFCVDATGSMQASNEFVTSYVRSVYMALTTLSESTRAGAVYYRHENDPAVMLDCCRKAIKYNDMTVKAIAPTPDPDQLVTEMRAMLPKEGVRISGHGGNGAYYSALEIAAKTLGTAKKGAARVIVCIGDAKMTPGSETKMVELGKSLKDGGYVTIFMNRDPFSAENLLDTSKAASGEEPIVYRDDVKKIKDGGDPYDGFEDTSFGTMCLRAIKASLPPAYADRGKPILHDVWTILVAKERAIAAKNAMK